MPEGTGCAAVNRDPKSSSIVKQDRDFSFRRNTRPGVCSGAHKAWTPSIL